jgi:F420-non-reducing hydrogenase iron-sulfur subunit
MNPEVLVFTCNWNGWSCIETAIDSGLKYPASVKVIKVNCLSRIHAGLMLQALDLGADGVMLLGCESGKCHFGSNSCYVTEEHKKAQKILELLGIWKNRLVLAQLPAFDGATFVKRITKLIEDIKKTAVTDASKKAGSPVSNNKV